MGETKSQIAFEEMGLGSVLRSYRLEVPPNQREYSWTEREVAQLLHDFTKAMNEDGAYFLGTLVTIPRSDDGALEVVDGQQRLATTAILLAAIRDYLGETAREDILVESINNEFLTGIDRVRRARSAKLKLNIDDNDLFNHIVVGADGTFPQPLRESHDLLAAARSLARAHVERVVAALDQPAHGDLLNAWVSFIEHRALVVLLKVPDQANAYRMFETLNDRGLRTSQADLIKNHLFWRSGERFREVQSKWSYMRGALEASEEEDITINFLRHALIVLRGPLREADVYEAVQDVTRSEQATVTFTTTLEALATVYVAATNPDHERWNGYPAAARRAIEVLNLLNIRPLRPLVLAVAARFPPRDAVAAFEFLIALGVRVLIAASTRSGSVETPLANAARAVYAGEIARPQALTRALGAMTPSDREFEVAFATARVSNSRMARYYLRSLELAAIGEAAPWFIPQHDPAVVNLEHVLPRKPNGGWPAFNDDEVRQKVNRLGNLTLMRAVDNADLKSASFREKRAAYEASPYVLTSEIAAHDEWTPADVDARQERLAALAVRVWPAR
jgi:hypothetical protein